MPSHQFYSNNVFLRAKTCIRMIMTIFQPRIYLSVLNHAQLSRDGDHVKSPDILMHERIETVIRETCTLTLAV